MTPPASLRKRLLDALRGRESHPKACGLTSRPVRARDAQGRRYSALVIGWHDAVRHEEGVITRILPHEAPTVVAELVEEIQHWRESCRT